MRRGEFPLAGKLVGNSVIRTVTEDFSSCIVRDALSAQGKSVFEVALADYTPGCEQELWHLDGWGAFVHRWWRTNPLLPNFIVVPRKKIHYYFCSADGLKIEELSDGRGRDTFKAVLESPHYIPMDMESYNLWVEEHRQYTWGEMDSDSYYDHQFYEEDSAEVESFSETSEESYREDEHHGSIQDQ